MKTNIQSRTKKFYILLLDVIISICIAYTFSDKNNYLCLSVPVIIGSIAIIARLILDLICKTVEEINYELEQEINIAKKQHKLNLLKSLSDKVISAVSNGNTDEYKEISQIYNEVSK